MTTDRRKKDVLLQAGSFVTASDTVRRLLKRLIVDGRLPQAVWSRIPVDAVFGVTVASGASFAYAATATDTLGRHLFWRGMDGWEPETTRVFAALAQSARGVVDAGAHTGLYTLLSCAVNPSARVYAFEPVPRIARVLRENLARNGWEARCTVFENPVAEADGYVPFHIPASSTPMSASLDPGGARIGRRDPAWQHTGGSVTRSFARAIDSCVADDAPVDLVKIDVEGFEDRAIAGLGSTLARWSPAVVFEVIEAAKRLDIERTFRENGYTFYKLGPSGPEESAGLAPPSNLHFRNYVAVRQSGHRAVVEALRDGR